MLTDTDRINFINALLKHGKKIEIHGGCIWWYDWNGEIKNNGEGATLREMVDDLVKDIGGRR